MKLRKAVILAAGKGTRMQSDLPKVLHKADGKPMVCHVIEAAKAAGVTDICLVVGHKAELVKEQVGQGVSYVEQKEQLGTGHAVMCAKDFIGTQGETMVLCGDTPLITGDTLKKLMDYHEKEGYAATVLSTILEDSTGYGRIVREKSTGAFQRIVEEKDATQEERQIKEVNSGMYVFHSKDLYHSLGKLTNNNIQHEYYLTDTLEIIGQNANVEAWTTLESDEIRGVNTISQLEEAEKILLNRK